MGCSCSTLAFDSQEETLTQQLERRPWLLCKPVQSFLGLHDSALHVASEARRFESLKQALHFLANADTATAQAAMQPYCRRTGLPLPGNASEATRLAVNMTNIKGQTPLMYACYANCPEIARELIHQGADPWAADRCGCRNALHYAAMSGSAACIEVLMKLPPRDSLVRQGVRYVNSRSLSGLTPLHYAVFYEREAAVEELLRHEPNINAASTGESYDVWVTYDTLSTPLHFAAYRESGRVAKLLLVHYARYRRTGTVLDPRLRSNSAGRLPWQVTRNRSLAAMLHPAMPLRDVLGGSFVDSLEGPEGLGPLSLAAIAGAALRQKLLHSVEVIEKECVEVEAMDRQQPTRRGNMLLCGTPRRGAAALASCGSVNREMFRLSSYRVHRPGSPLLPSAPRRAPTLDRLDGPLPHPPDEDEGFLDLHRTSQTLAPNSPQGLRAAPRPASGRGFGGPGTRSGRIARLSATKSRVGRVSNAGGGGGSTFGGAPGGSGVASGALLGSPHGWHPGGGSCFPDNHTGWGAAGGGTSYYYPDNIPCSIPGGGSPTGGRYLPGASAAAATAAAAAGSGAGGLTTAGSLPAGGSPVRGTATPVGGSPTQTMTHGSAMALPALPTPPPRPGGDSAGGAVAAATAAGVHDGSSPDNTGALRLAGDSPFATAAMGFPPTALGASTAGTGTGMGTGTGLGTGTGMGFADVPYLQTGAGPTVPLPPTALGARTSGTLSNGGTATGMGFIGAAYPQPGAMFPSAGGASRPAGDSPTSAAPLFTGPVNGGSGGAASGATPFAAMASQPQPQWYATTVGGGAVVMSQAPSLLAGAVAWYGGTEVEAPEGGSVGSNVGAAPGRNGGGGGCGGLYGSSNGGDDVEDDDHTCNVCFARPETVAPATCRHGLCATCAGELCRAVVNRPLLCPFCRQPVTDFVRVMPPPPRRVWGG